ncbi:DUF2303 family protein [Propionibacteriaceae bacterium Y2011]
MSEYRTEAEAVTATVLAGTDPTYLETGVREVLLHRDATGQPYLIDTETFQSAPARTRRDVVVEDVASFKCYWARQETDELPMAPEIWANRTTRTITAIFNPSTSHAPAWGDHTCTLRLQLSPEWMAWTEMSGQFYPQVRFSEFLEDHLADVQAPAAADMLELAQEFQATNKVTFESSHRNSDGTRRAVYKDDLKASGGKGAIDIPERITLALRPFVGSPRFEVGAWFRFRITSDGLVLAIKLDQPDAVLDAAFDEIGLQLTELAPVLHGRVATEGHGLQVFTTD